MWCNFGAKIVTFSVRIDGMAHCWVIRFINYLAYYEADPEEEHHYQGDATDR